MCPPHAPGMNTLAQLLDLVSPRKNAVDIPSSHERAYVAAAAFVVALACAALWGLAAGSGAGHLAIQNVLSVPMLVAVSTVASLPLGLLAFRLTQSGGRTTDLVLAHSAALFGGALVLLLLSPLVALYQLSSAWAGPLIAVGTAVVAFGCGVALFVRVLGKLAGVGGTRPFIVPVGLLVVVQIASLAQLSSLAPPVLPTRTAFGHGVDALVRVPDPSAAR